MGPGSTRMRADDTVAVRIRLPRTWLRTTLGAFALVFAVLTFRHWVLSLGLTWLGFALLGKAEQVVSIENDLLVFRLVTPFAPNVTRRIGMDRVRGRSFTVARFKGDETISDFRPLFGSRLWLYGDGGVLIHHTGMSLTLGEADVVKEALDRLLATEGPGLRRAPAGVEDKDLYVP